MAEPGASGGYRTLSERLDAEKFDAGTWVPVSVSEPGITDIYDLFPEASPQVSFRQDTFKTVHVRGALFVDYDTIYDADGIDYSGFVSQPGTFTLFTVPEEFRPEYSQGFPGVIAYQKDAVTLNFATFTRVAPDGTVQVSLGGYAPDGVTPQHELCSGAVLSIVVSGSYSIAAAPTAV